MHAIHAVCGFLVVTGQSQLMPPGTIDVPVPRAGDCGGDGPSTYVYRLSSKQPNDYFPDACKGLGGATVHFNDPCAWARGQAQITTAHFTNMCKGATRTIHWHNGADEWGYVNKGRLETIISSPDGLPWPSSHNVISQDGVWYFPAGTLHGLMCHTPEEEGGCEFTIVFASPQAAEPNGHNLDTTLAQAPNDVASAVLGVSAENYAAYRLAFARAANSVHYSNRNMTAPIVTMVAPGACEPKCPQVAETLAVPAAVEAAAVEQKVLLAGAPGVVLYRIRQEQFAFARTMSQERTVLAPGAVRPMVWASADAVMVVIRGKVVYSLEGGIPGSESKSVFPNEILGAGDVAYIPNARAYWFREASGTEEAMTITVFNVGNWKSFEMARSLAEMNSIDVASNLHVPELKKGEQAEDTGVGYSHGLLRATAVQSGRQDLFGSMSSFTSLLMCGLAVWALALTGAVVFLLRKVHARAPPVMNALLA